MMPSLRVAATALRALPVLTLAAALAACGGRGEPKVSGTVTGLASGQSVTLQNNYTDATTVTANGRFTFPLALSGGYPYDVTVLTQPQGQSCTVTNGYGSIDQNGDSVDSVVVTCVDVGTLGGSVSGLPTGSSVTLANGAQQLVLAGNGSFVFPGSLPVGTAYGVVVAVQPAGATCVVANGQGVAVAGVAAVVTVQCR